MSAGNSNEARMSKRAMLAKLGLAVTAAYIAPVMLRLDDAHASSRSFSGSGRRGGGRRRSFS